MTSQRRLLLASVLIGVCAASFAVGAESILLPATVPAFNQNYTDGPDAWGNCALGTGGCPDRIATTGCLVTTFASVLAYYGVEVDVPARASCTGRARTGMDPGILNDWLRANGGFGHCAQDPYGSCCLVWEALPGDVELTFYANRSDDGLNPVSSVVIDHALRGGRPVVAGVHWDSYCRAGSTQTEDCHWIVLTGKIGERYTIVDPMNLDSTDPNGTRTTLDAGTRGAYIIDRFVVVSPPADGPETGSQDTESDLSTSEPAAGVSGVSSALVLVAILGAVLAVILLSTR